MHAWLGEADLERALRRLRRDLGDDPAAAAGEFLRFVVGRAASDARMWVEHTPATVRRAAGLHALVPDLRIVHVVRDGRDTAVSMTRRPWAPDDPVDALRLWGLRMRRAHEALASVPPGAVHEFRWEDLVGEGREPTYSALLEFLGLDDRPGARRLLQRLSPERAHVAQWRDEVPEHRRDEFLAVYGAILEGLRRSGAGLLGLDDGVAVPGDVEHRIAEQRRYEAEAEAGELRSEIQELRRSLAAESARAERKERRLRRERREGEDAAPGSP